MRVATLFALVASAASALAVVTPVSVDTLDVTGSTTSTLDLAFSVTVTAEAADAGRSVDFTFGSADGTQAFGSGTFVLPAEIPSGPFSLTATALFNPSADAHTAAQAVLSAYSSNLDSAISVTGVDGNFLNVPLSKPGVEILQKLYLVVSLSVLTTQQSNVQLQVYNAFTVPLTFTGLTSTAVATINNAPLTLGTITQNPLPAPITVAGKSTLRTPNIAAKSVFNLVQAAGVLSAVSGGKTIPATVNAVSYIKLGDYATQVAIVNKVVPAAQA